MEQNISGFSLLFGWPRQPEIEGLALRTSSAALRLHFAQNDSDARFCSF
jgi:hypothetical protein